MDAYIHFHYLKPGVLHLFHIRLQHYDFYYGTYNMYACTSHVDEDDDDDDDDDNVS